MIKNCVSINLLSSLLHEQITYKKKKIECLTLKIKIKIKKWRENKTPQNVGPGRKITPAPKSNTSTIQLLFSFLFFPNFPSPKIAPTKWTLRVLVNQNI